MRNRLTATLLGVLGLALLGAAPATAAPALTLDVHHGPTNFAAGETGQYWLDLANVGGSATTGTLTVQLKLQNGLTRAAVWKNAGVAFGGPTWSCPGSPGDTTITCTTSGSIPRHYVEPNLVVEVNVSGSLPSGIDRVATATVSGGGAPAAAGCAPGVAACASEITHIDAAPAGFGLLPGTFAPDFLEPDAITPSRQAGGRPPLFSVPFDLTTVDAPDLQTNALEQKGPAGNLRNLAVDLPPGFAGDLTAVGECSAANFTLGHCPASSQVGRIDLQVMPIVSPGIHFGFTPVNVPVYNLVHPAGTLADLAFVVHANPIHIKSALDPAHDYALRSTVSDVNESYPPFLQKLTLWGVPVDPSHDSERCGNLRDTSTECASDGPLKPFFTMPYQCDTEMSMKIGRVDSWQESGLFGSEIEHDLGKFEGCEQIPFDPSVSVAPTTDVADSPSGLDVQIDVPQHNSCTQITPAPPAGQQQYECETATSPLKDGIVTLPEGITVNPASANGLDACTPAQISLGTDDPVQCPNGSKLADVKVTTPLLPSPIEGTVYLATPHQNPFDSLLAGYIVLSDPDRGILVKIPGEIAADPATGQLTGAFKDNPQLPFSQLQLHFKGGAHSALVTPKTCGTYNAQANLSPWSGNPAAELSSDFAIDKVPQGSCASSEAQLPNSPSFDAGTVSPVSKAYSPFVLHLRRQDGSQRFGAFNVTLPEGLTGKLAGTALCPEAALAAAQAKSGREEHASPSCPAASHVGEVVAATGAGPSPYYAKGDAYLAGPYKGAPVSLAVITPAVAGPFDLGTIVIRTPLRIDPVSARITAVSDPIPQMLQGIPTDVRSVDVIMDRPEFTLTGTGCDPAQVEGLLTSTLGQATPLAARYQLSDCTRLPFKPKISLSLKGSTARAGHPALTVVLQPRPGDANIASLQLAMPHAEFLDQGHIKTICTRVQFAADQCPAGAVYGQASVQSPLLDYPLTGNVYLRSSDNVLPDLVPDLRGPSYQPVKVEASGKTDSIRGGIRNTFSFVPDAPFSKLVTKLPGGKKGLLENSRDLCARTYRATVKYTAHNGLSFVDRPKLGVKCKGTGKKGKGKKHQRRAVR
jgi:hypothetical protein